MAEDTSHTDSSRGSTATIIWESETYPEAIGANQLPTSRVALKSSRRTQSEMCTGQSYSIATPPGLGYEMYVVCYVLLDVHFGVS